MSRIIIENRTTLGNYTALACVNQVIAKGKISGEGEKSQYCYHTTLKVSAHDKTVHVSAFKNKASDRLVVHYNDGVNHAED